MAGTPEIQYDAGPVITITFDLPPSKDPFNEKVRGNFRTTTSANGTTQTSHYYNEEVRAVSFTFVTKAIADLVRTCYKDFLAKGKTITYIPDVDTPGTTFNYTWAGKDLNIKRSIPDGAGGFLYDFTLIFRRVI